MKSATLRLTIGTKLSPSTVYLLWNVVLILYTLWPYPYRGEVRDPRTFLRLPLEYVPLLLILAAGWLSGLIQGGPIFRPRPKYLALCALGVILYGALSLAWVVNYRAWLQYFAMWIAYFVLFFGMVGTLSREEPERLRKFLDQFFWLLSIYALLIVGRQLVFPPQPIPLEEFWHWDFTPIIRYRISQVLTILPFLPVAVRMYFVSGRLLYLAFLLVGSTDLLLSFSRDGIAGWFAVVILSFLIGRGDVLRWENLRRVGGVIAAFLIALGTSVTIAGVHWIYRVQTIFFINRIWFGGLQGPETSVEGGGGRPILLREGIRIFWDHLWLGTGVGNYLEYFRAVGIPLERNGKIVFLMPASPHNFFLTYLAEFGVLGFLPLIGFFLYLLYFLWRRAGRVQQRDEKLVLQGFLVANVGFLILFFASDFMTSPYIWFFWGLSVAFALSMRPEPDAKRENPVATGSRTAGKVPPRLARNANI